MAVFFARMVMPRSRSSSFESMTRSTCCSLDRNVPLCCSMASTSVVLPWSTCAMIAILRIPELKGILPECLSIITLLCGRESKQEISGPYVESVSLQEQDQEIDAEQVGLH